MSITLPVLTFLPFNVYIGNEVNPTVVNGILTVTAIIFAFITFELREIKSYNEKILLSFPLLLFLMVTLEYVFTGAIAGKMIELYGIEATSNCLFTILYIVPIMFVKNVHEEIEQRRKKEEACDFCF